MDWETLFEPQIIKRGWDYYQQDLVTSFRHRDGQITATVLGSKRYQVTLDVDGDRLPIRWQETGGSVTTGARP